MRPIHDLSRRDLRPELMDQPQLNHTAHWQALAGLARLNRFSNTAGVMWREIRNRLPHKSHRPVRIVDVASGGGDLCLALGQKARREGVAAHIIGLDLSLQAIDFARRRGRHAAAANVEFRPADVLRDPLPADVDVFTCSLFLHHLTEADTILLLNKLAAAQPQLMLLSDLRRCRAGHLLARAACHLLSRSPVVHHDGPQSVAASYTIEEMLSLCRTAGLARAQIVRRWPLRMLVIWSG